MEKSTIELAVLSILMFLALGVISIQAITARNKEIEKLKKVLAKSTTPYFCNTGCRTTKCRKIIWNEKGDPKDPQK